MKDIQIEKDMLFVEGSAYVKADSLIAQMIANTAEECFSFDYITRGANTSKEIADKCKNSAWYRCSAHDKSSEVDKLVSSLGLKL